MTYGDGVAIEFSDTLPIHIQKAENETKKLLGIDCKFYGCFKKGHKINGAKKCHYNWWYDDEEIKDAVRVYLKKIYPTHYGECRKYSSRITIPRYCLHGLQNCISRGVTDSTFAFYESLFEEKVIFPPLCFFLPTFIRF